MQTIKRMLNFKKSGVSDKAAIPEDPLQNEQEEEEDDHEEYDDEVNYEL